MNNKNKHFFDNLDNSWGETISNTYKNNINNAVYINEDKDLIIFLEPNQKPYSESSDNVLHTESYVSLDKKYEIHMYGAMEMYNGNVFFSFFIAIMDLNKKLTVDRIHYQVNKETGNLTSLTHNDYNTKLNHKFIADFINRAKTKMQTDEITDELSNSLINVILRRFPSTYNN